MNKKIHKGFTLIEVLVTIVILALGLLGLASLQSYGLRTNHSAYLRSQATMLAYDIVDRMRVNRDEARNGGYDIAIGTTATSPTNCASVAVSCTPAQIRQFDLAQWENSVNTLLPSGDGAITRAGSVITITVRWDDSRGETVPQNFIMTTEL